MSSFADPGPIPRTEGLVMSTPPPLVARQVEEAQGSLGEGPSSVLPRSLATGAASGRPPRAISAGCGARCR